MSDGNEWAQLEAMTHMRAREIAVEVFGPVVKAETGEYAPPFAVIKAVRERCIRMDEDCELLEDEIEESKAELIFARDKWLPKVAPGVSFTVEDVLSAFDQLSTEPTTEDLVEEIHESLSKKRK